MTVDGSRIEDNHSTGNSGGGLFIQGSAEITNSDIHDNSAAIDGGGIALASGTVAQTLSVRESRVSSNTAANNGGGILALGGTFEGTLNVETSLIDDNHTTVGKGGGISTTNTALTVSKSSISNNTANTNGGGIDNFGGSLTVRDSTIATNDSQGGGGISTSNVATIEHTTVSDNFGGNGGGGGLNTAGATISYSTFTLNSANAPGGGILGDVSLLNSIVAKNTDTSGQANDISGSAIANYSLVSDTAGATISGTNNQLNMNAMLGLLANNGGSTETHMPQPGSPAIDMGDSGFTSPPDYDQRGFSFDRIINGQIDIGAVEFGADSADFDTDGDVDGADFLAWQRGVGSVPAFHADGDANVDGTVDALDLSVWEATFGQVDTTPIAAVTSTLSPEFASIGTLATTSELTAKQAQPSRALAATDLISTASATEVLVVSDEEEPTIVAQTAVIEAVFAATYKGDGLVLTAIPEREIQNVEPYESEETDMPWLTDELLERVFG